MSGLVQVQRDGGREFQIIAAATLKLQEPDDVRTNGGERRLVLESLADAAAGLSVQGRCFVGAVLIKDHLLFRRC